MNDQNYVQRDELIRVANQWMQPELFKDYCPNGLQVEGKSLVGRIGSAVTASMDVIEAAAAKKIDLLLVHHGYFWRGEDERIVGMKYRRIANMIAHGINLLAYHLPLDAHPVMGNNAQLALKLGIKVNGGLDRDSQYPIGNIGELMDGELTLAAFVERIKTVLGREPLVIGAENSYVGKIGWCTGGAQSYIERAYACGMKTFLTGEVSEQTVHFARENGMNFIAAGHHATERYGVQALGHALAQHFGIEHEFIDCDNPV